MLQNPSTGRLSLYDIERRRCGRIYLKLPLLVRWKSEAGELVQEPAVTEELSASGGLLHIKRLPPKFAELEVTHSAVEEPVGARIIHFEEPQADGLGRIAISYAQQTDTLWGVTFPPQRAAPA